MSKKPIDETTEITLPYTQAFFNNDGIWNEVPRILKITVLPPWYKTWYAYLTYTLIVLTLLYLFNSYPRKQKG